MAYDFSKIKDQLIKEKSFVTVRFNSLRKNKSSDSGVFIDGNEDFFQYKPFDDIIEKVTVLGEIQDEIQTVSAEEIKEVEVSHLIKP